MGHDNKIKLIAAASFKTPKPAAALRGRGMVITVKKKHPTQAATVITVIYFFETTER